MDSPGTIHASTIILTEQIAFRDIYTYALACGNNFEKEAMSLKGSKEWYMGGSGVRKEKREKLCLYYSLKRNKRKTTWLITFLVILFFSSMVYDENVNYTMILSLRYN